MDSPMKSNPYWLAVLFALTLIACGPSDPPADDDDDVPIENFEDIQNEIFTPSCTFVSCHGATLPPNNLSLLQGDACGALVNVQSFSVSDDRVEPNDPDNSFLYLKITGPLGPFEGQLMPSAGGGLSQKKIDAIYDWINNGAICP